MYVYVRHLAIRESRHQRTPGRHQATKRSFLATSNLIRQWIKERGIISLRRLDLVGGELDQVESMWGRIWWGRTRHGRNRQLPYREPDDNPSDRICCQGVARQRFGNFLYYEHFFPCPTPFAF